MTDRESSTRCFGVRRFIAAFRPGHDEVGLRKEVTSKGQADLGHQDGQPIRLRFRMDKAQWFGLDFE